MMNDETEPLTDPTQFTNTSSMKMVIKETTPPIEKASRITAKMKSVKLNDEKQSDRIPLTSSMSNDELGGENSSVNLDPVPRGHTILTKTASSPGQVQRNRDSIIGDQKDETRNVLVNARANLGTVGLNRRHSLLPRDVQIKYDRYTYLPGVKAIPSNTLEWKVPLLQRKNQQVIEDYLQKREAVRKLREQERLERERLIATPEWKRPLVKQREDRKKTEQMRRKEQEQRDANDQVKFNSLPPWQQELILRKREQQRLDSLPDWQRELIVKKRVANNRKSFEKK